MNYDNEIEMVSVEFVGGPLDGQWRNLQRGRTTYNAPPRLSDFLDLTNPNPGEMAVKYTTYKIERSCIGRSGTVGFRESFKGVLA